MKDIENMENNVIRTIPVNKENMKNVQHLPCYRITLPNGEIILNSDMMTVRCRNVAKVGDTIIEFVNHKWEVIHPL